MRSATVLLSEQYSVCGAIWSLLGTGASTRMFGTVFP